MRSSLQREAGSQKLGPVREVKIELVRSPGSAVAGELEGGGAEPLHPSRSSLSYKTFILHHFPVVVVNEVSLGVDKLSPPLPFLGMIQLQVAQPRPPLLRALGSVNCLKTNRAECAGASGHRQLLPWLKTLAYVSLFGASTLAGWVLGR